MTQFSRCSLGRERWFWCVWRDDAIFEGLSSFDSGFTTSSAEAEEVVKQWYPEARQVAAYYASHADTREIAARRMPNTTTTESKPVEFLYSDHYSEFSESTWSTALPIVKKTKKCVFVIDWNDRLRRLDRAKFEAEGEIMGRGWWECFFTTPIEKRRSTYRPEWADILGVTASASIDEIADAYRRKALETHPDKGGDPEEFKRVQAAFEEAGTSWKGVQI